MFNLQPSQPGLSDDEFAKELAIKIDKLGSDTWGALIRAQNDGINYIWHNEVLSPQRMCDELGVHAVKVFDRHGRITELIIELAAVEGITPTLLWPTYAFTRNPDGTVTVHDGVPYEPPQGP